MKDCWKMSGNVRFPWVPHVDCLSAVHLKEVKQGSDSVPLKVAATQLSGKRNPSAQDCVGEDPP